MKRYDDAGADTLWPQARTIWIANPFDDIPGEGLPPLRFWSLARVLAARGHDVVWWTADFSHRRKARRELPADVAEYEGFGLRLVPVRPYRKNVSLARFASHRDYGRNFERIATNAVASGLLERPDLIVASLPPLEGPEAAARLAHKLDAALVVDLMDLWPETFERLVPGPEWVRRLLSPLLLGGMARRRSRVLAAADGIAAATHTYAAVALAAEPGLAAKPRHVCRLGGAPQEFDPKPRAIPVDSPAENRPGEIQCVYAGSIEGGQDVEALIEAAGLLAADGVAARIHIAGTGRLLDELKAQAAEIPAQSSCRVTFHGLLGRRAYTRLLSLCDVGLVCVKPHTLVAIPYKACDYASAGLAIVNSLPGELADLLDDYHAGIAYQAGNARSLADAIRQLAQQPRLLADAARGSRRLAETLFDREKTYAAYADWLESVMREPADVFDEPLVPAGSPPV